MAAKNQEWGRPPFSQVPPPRAEAKLGPYDHSPDRTLVSGLEDASNLQPPTSNLMPHADSPNRPSTPAIPFAPARKSSTRMFSSGAWMRVSG